MTQKSRLRKRTSSGVIQRKSVVGASGVRGLRLRGLKKNYGTTKNLQPLIEPEVVQKGIFSFDSLDVFSRPDSVSIDITSVQDGEQLPIVNPVFSFKQLIHLYLTSTTLRECIKAYQTNIEEYGYSLDYIGPEDKRYDPEVGAERKRVETILATICQGGETLLQARRSSRVDKEVIGARAFEVIHDAMGRVSGIRRIPTNTLLMTRLEKEAIEVPVYNTVTRTFEMQKRRFRRFLQRDAFGNMVYFKELGDPRPINPKTGKVDTSLSIEEEATSVFYDAYYTPGTPYGTPQWAAYIPSLMGAREAETVNLSFFRDNAIPAMAVLVSGGSLTEESFNKIESYFTEVRGRDSSNRIVVLEASADIQEAAGIDGSIPAPKVDIKSMLSERQNEGLFKDYILSAGSNVRQAFRLPPIYIGSAEEYNRASAFASIQTAEQQVFVPERHNWDNFVNDVVLSGYGLQYWRVVSTAPAYNDPQEISQLLQVMGREGALTPNVCIDFANRYLGAHIEPILEEWGDMPFLATLVNLNRGIPVDGFEYIFDNLKDAANGFENRGTNAGNGDAGEDPEQIEVQNSIAKFFDEFAERGSRAYQNVIQLKRRQ